MKHLRWQEQIDESSNNNNNHNHNHNNNNNSNNNNSNNNRTSSSSKNSNKNSNNNSNISTLKGKTEVRLKRNTSAQCPLEQHGNSAMRGRLSHYRFEPELKTARNK
jgi:hypothetical protein